LFLFTPPGWQLEPMGTTCLPFSVASVCSWRQWGSISLGVV